MVCRMRIERTELSPSVRADTVSLEDRSSDSDACTTIDVAYHTHLDNSTRCASLNIGCVGSDSNYAAEAAFEGLFDSRCCTVACFCARTALEGSVPTNQTPPPLAQQVAAHKLSTPCKDLFFPKLYSLLSRQSWTGGA